MIDFLSTASNSFNKPSPSPSTCQIQPLNTKLENITPSITPSAQLSAAPKCGDENNLPSIMPAHRSIEVEFAPHNSPLNVFNPCLQQASASPQRAGKYIPQGIKYHTSAIT